MKDPLAVRFQRLQQAKALRSQTDDSAKAGLTLSFSTQWELVRGTLVLRAQHDQRNASIAT